ncbi:MAG: uracil-DNA glycosylase [Elusimicrobia bacterium]|nr:uracil-DNA glycosylase [Elusimicrobiota bacterium]
MNMTAKQEWTERIQKTFNAFSPISFSAYKSKTISPVLKTKSTVPHAKNVYKALELVPFEKVKVVFLGQDPYYQAKGKEPYATGLAFALNPKILKDTELHRLKGGKSLRSIFKALTNELGNCPTDTTLTTWAQQGVLLLNSSLTTKRGTPGAHDRIWRGFLAAVILALNAKKESVSYVLTCKRAKNLLPLIAPHHKIYFNYKHPSRCWRVTNTKGQPVKFFREITKAHAIQWDISN